MERPDLTDRLVHFVKGEFPEAYQTFHRIIQERRLLGGSGFIRGQYACICFSEAPLPLLYDVYVRARPAFLKYQPFGFVVTKPWLFPKGGRPVIYQADAEFEALPETHRYRHVRYEPTLPQPIDFTWEREWRIQLAELPLDPATTSLVVPTSHYCQELLWAHEREQDSLVEQYTYIFDQSTAEQYRECFPWQILSLEDLALG